MARATGITGIQHVAVLTPRLEEAERHYGMLFRAEVMFRTTTYEGDQVSVDPKHDWEAIRRARLKIGTTFLRAGALTIAVIDEPAGRDGPLGHLCLSCTDVEQRRIRDLVRELGLREHRDSLGAFRFRDAFGVLWEISRKTEQTHRPERRLDLGTGRVS